MSREPLIVSPASIATFGSGMSRASRIFVLLLATLLTIVFFISVASSGAEPGATSQGDRIESPGILRTVKAVRRPWVSECDYDYCGFPLIEHVEVQSNGFRPRNVVVTVTLDVKTTGRDAASFTAALHPVGTVNRPFPMRPVNHIIRSPLRSTSTLVWVAKDVPAAETYTVDIAVDVRLSRHDNDDLARATGRRIVTVVDLSE